LWNVVFGLQNLHCNMSNMSKYTSKHMSKHMFNMSKHLFHLPPALRRLGHLAWVSIFAVLGFMYTSGIVLYQGGKVATERHDFLEGEI